MKCPVCMNPDLVMTERQGIEIDYCPQCRGVWLDRGELDKIIERSAAAPYPQAGQAPPAQYPQGGQAPPPAYPQAGHAPPPGYPQAPTHVRGYDGDYRQVGYKKKRRGLLGEIFDFD
jgi:Zn-finger nucleic acid-binding protein